MGLQKFLSTDFRDAMQRLARVSEQVRAAARTLTENCDQEGKLAYHLKEGAAPDTTEDYSQSTHAMVLHALAFHGRKLNGSAIVPGRVAFLETTEDDQHQLEATAAAIDRIAKGLGAHIMGGNKSKNNDKTPLTSSGTYGVDDPLTLSWLIDILADDELFGLPDFAERAVQAALRTIKRAWTQPDYICFNYGNRKYSPRPAQHAFPVLRTCLIWKAIREIKALSQDQIQILTDLDKRTSKLLDYFMGKMHEHLSWAAIPDSRFDPAEMVFCVEGALTLNNDSIDRNTFDRVIDILKQSQEKSAYWRPVAPILFTAQGMALHPLSIEVVNSLMRICAISDNNKRHGRLFAKLETMLRRYYEWVSAQRVKINVAGKEFSGWHSENLSEKSRIDIWETSQVLLFLMSYGALLREQVAVDALLASGLKIEDLRRKKSSEYESAKQYWGYITAIFEPFHGGDDRYRVYEEIGKGYVDPRLTSKGDKKYSMVLYGPPGTGKSTIPEELARCLEYPLITVTISDFLADGAAQTEQRAKALFQVLEAQRDVVVLFDEIDHFILDRESKIYREQETVFQFMPPGMLTKLRDLYKKKNCIFIIATNYQERIDAAAIRLGRIDDRFLVLPPDRLARLKILGRLETKAFKTKNPTHAEDTGVSSELDDVLERTALWIFNEIEKAWQMTEGDTFELRLSAMAKLTKDEKVVPSISLKGYRARFKSEENKQPPAKEPFEEFMLLVYYRYVDAFRSAVEADNLRGRIKDAGDTTVLQEVSARFDDAPAEVANNSLVKAIKAVLDAAKEE